MASADGEIRYLNHEINGRMYGAWYRVTADRRVEIYWHARIASAPCDSDSPQIKALKLMKDLIRRWERPLGLGSDNRSSARAEEFSVSESH